MISKFIIYRTFLAFLLISPGTGISEQSTHGIENDHKTVESDKSETLEPFALTPDAPLTSADLTPLSPFPSKSPPEPSPGIDDYDHVPSPGIKGGGGSGGGAHGK